VSREATRQRVTQWLPRWFPSASRRIDVWILALLAYLPALGSSPGRMPADTKLYLYTDPGGLLGRAASTFEPDQFAGWVPHQQITYLWPSGPWFWLFDVLSVPDWIAHRLWIGTIMFAAGMGARQCARLLGHAGGPVLAAAVVYQLSPLLLPYISRTSLLLLPWAGLGWIVAATIRASLIDRHAASLWARWREPALIALIVATVGSSNATALAMIVPAPAIWLVSVAVRRAAPLRDLVLTVGRVTVACVAVSLWWMAMFIVQSRYGAPVLLYSETLEDVSRNSTGSEVLRGFGYWLFYGRDAFAATTTSSLGYLTRTSSILVSFAMAIIGLAGIAFGRGRHRRFAGLLAFIGMVLAVGVHPFDASSPLVRLLTGGSDTGLALALRSSTRAVPVMALGIALGAAALVERVPARRFRMQLLSTLTWRRLASGLIVTVAIANMPSLWKAQLVDPAIDRDADLPTAWLDAAAQLDADQSGTRVLQLPGAEFGAFDWGYTVDPPLVSTTDRAVITRDLLPLGSAPAMDLLYALDDRVQLGVLEPASVAPIARLLAVGTIWLAGDADSLRFRTPSAGTLAPILSDAPDLDATATFGAPAAVGSAVKAALDSFGRPLVDADAIAMQPMPNASVSLYDVDRASTVTRVKTDEVIVSGSGDGVIDAAAAGLIDGTEMVRYGAGVDTIETTDRVVITDSNRDRAHHWRSSQDVTGHTEPGGPSTDVLDATAADQRLDPLGTAADIDAQTISIQRGPVTAVASGYGEPFAYRPEDRAVMAIDGDPATAWSVGDHDDPVGAVLRLSSDEPIGELVLHQVAPHSGGRQISSVDIDTGDSTQRVELTMSSTDASGQRVVLDSTPSRSIDIVITSVTVGDPARSASRASVGFTEIDTGLPPTTEFIRPPVETLQRLTSEHASLDIVLTRERVEATSTWRSDPEPVLRRLLPLTANERFDVELAVRLDQRSDDVQLAELLGDEGAIADRRLPGVAHRGSAAVDGDLATAWLTPLDDVLGATLTVTSANGSITALDLVQPTGAWSTISELVVSGPDGNAVVAVPAPDAGGRSLVSVPDGVVVADAPFALTISEIRPLRRIERRYGDEVTMPAGISELTGTTGVDAPRLAPDRPIGRSCETSLLTVDGASVPLEFNTTAAALLEGQPATATLCSDSLALGTGEHSIVDQAAGTGFTVDRVVFSSIDGTPTEVSPADPPSTVVVTGSDTRRRSVEVDCPQGCWLIFGMGHNAAWSASGPSGDLGEPEVVDGGFNGWWIEPTNGPEAINITWTAQRLVTIGLAVSLAAVLACAGVLLAAHRRRPTGAAAAEAQCAAETPVRIGADPTVASIVKLGLIASSVALLVGPLGGAVVLGVGAGQLAMYRRGRPVRIMAMSGLGMAAYVAIAVAVIERRKAPFPNAGWTNSFEHLNGLALTAVALVAASTMLNPMRNQT
jgi:arabinofuranan 3-O-arabinosyltransferase